MLQQKGCSPPQIQQWYDKLAPLIEQAREALRRVGDYELVLRSGCVRDADGNLLVPFFWREYLVSGDDFSVRQADTGEPVSSFIQSLLLTYLVTADGTPPSGRWIGFRELPEGLFYAQAFQGYAGDRLARELAGGLDALRYAAKKLGGEPIGLGDAGYAFVIFPRLSLAVVYWEGDDEFPSRAQVLFEDTAAHYMPTDGLAILGSRLVDQVLRAAR